MDNDNYWCYGELYEYGVWECDCEEDGVVYSWTCSKEGICETCVDGVCISHETVCLENEDNTECETCWDDGYCERCNYWDNEEIGGVNWWCENGETEWGV